MGYNTSLKARKERIELALINIDIYERALYGDIESFENTMNECECEDRQVYDFKYTLNLEGEPYHYQLFCINCGGFIEPQDMLE